MAIAATLAVIQAAVMSTGLPTSPVTHPIPSWKPLGSHIHAERTMTPAIKVMPGAVILASFQDRATQGNRGSVKGYSYALDQWVDYGQPGSASIDDDWWGVVCQGALNQLFRCSRDYGVPYGGLNFRVYGINASGQPDWIPLGPQPASSGQAHYIDMESDGNGWPIVIYQDGRPGNPTGEDGAGTVLCINPATGQATALGGAGFTKQYNPSSDITYGNIEVALDGTVWAAWQERISPNRGAHVARWDPVSVAWVLVGSPTSGLPGAGDHISLALSPSGEPCVAYRTYSPLRFVVRGFDSGTQTWAQVGGNIGVGQLSGGAYPGFSQEAGYRERTPFAAGPQGGLYIAYRSPTGAFDRLKVESCTNGTWSLVGSTGTLPGTGSEDYASLDILMLGSVEVPVLSCRRNPLLPTEALVSFIYH